MIASDPPCCLSSLNFSCRPMEELLQARLLIQHAGLHRRRAARTHEKRLRQLHTRRGTRAAEEEADDEVGVGFGRLASASIFESDFEGEVAEEAVASLDCLLRFE